MASKDPSPTPPQSPAKAKGDPILRNTLRYTISAKEYKTLHEWFISRSPQAVRKRAPTPNNYASLVQTKDHYNGAAIRASLRVFIAAQTSLQLWELIKTNILAKRRPSRYVRELNTRAQRLINWIERRPEPQSSHRPTSAYHSPSL